MSREQAATVVLLAVSGLFALAVWVGRPAATSARASADVPALSAAAFAPSTSLSRGAVLKPLILPPGVLGVDLAAMPDRLANEAPPAALQRVVTIRGIPGVASVNGPAMIAWTESGIAYWLASPSRSIDDLILIADQLR